MEESAITSVWIIVTVLFQGIHPHANEWS